MNKRKLIFFVPILLILIGGYYIFDYYTGNHIEIDDVFKENASDDQVAEDQVAEDQSTVQSNEDLSLEPFDLNGDWEISEDSSVYLSIKTSKEEVNIRFSEVSGRWEINQAELNLTEANAIVGINSIDSGNGQRDSHVKGDRFLKAEQFPEATFQLHSIENWSTEWQSGQTNSILLTGDLTIKDITKSVTFETEVLPENEILKLKADTSVTFDDFGMKNPHTVLLDTENDVLITLQLVLIKK
ncbi:YceI family protein [Chengkuizengella sediminis]|uniref:YceI family protein n=1 Tax=Chengkuizengella sediminis TaxID=1885917 RepID=UPI001389D2F1|nr:YceI family protein [Chengkuizengella sediminis]NDI33888.1 YceI family protein [Chengkuizengella sediminis]